MGEVPLTVTDHLGRLVTLPARPRRIVSLCPSQTETLLALGLKDRLAGRTLFCIHPQGVKDIPSIGGTKNCKPERILARQPDLVIAEKEENTAETVAALENEVPVFVTDVKTEADALRMVRDLGLICGVNDGAAQLAARIETAWQSLPRLHKPLRTLYLIWKEPWMAAGTGTFIHSVMQRVGLENVISAARYPELSPEALIALQPELVLLSSEPYPFQEKHLGALRDLLPQAQVRLADGEIFSWYGARMLHAPAYLSPFLQSLGSPAN